MFKNCAGRRSPPLPSSSLTRRAAADLASGSASWSTTVAIMRILCTSQLERIVAHARDRGSQTLVAASKRFIDHTKPRAAVLVPLFNLQRANGSSNGVPSSEGGSAFVAGAHALFTLRASGMSSHGGEVCQSTCTSVTSTPATRVNLYSDCFAVPMCSLVGLSKSHYGYELCNSYRC